MYSASQKKCPLAKCNNWGPLELNCNIPYTYKGYLGMPRYYMIRFDVSQCGLQPLQVFQYKLKSLRIEAIVSEGVSAW